MPAHKLLPDIQTLQHWIEDEGLTHQQIADRVFQQTGHPVSRSTVSAALHRAGLSANGARYREELPWRVKMEHIAEYPARMLRLLGRRRAGGEMTEDENKRLDSWLAQLEAEHAVVAYDASSRFGFYYIEKDDSIDGKDGIPIRIKMVHIDT
jgi:hypothetical protein